MEVFVRTDRGDWLSFERPVRVLEAHAPDAVSGVLAEVEAMTREARWHAVGFVAYDAAGAFGLPVCPHTSDLPLALFGLFTEANVRRLPALPRSGSFDVRDLRPSKTRDAFDAAFDRVKEELAAGNSYQVNYTFQLQGRFVGDPLGLLPPWSARKTAAIRPSSRSAGTSCAPHPRSSFCTAKGHASNPAP